MDTLFFELVPARMRLLRNEQMEYNIEKDGARWAGPLELARVCVRMCTREKE